MKLLVRKDIFDSVCDTLGIEKAGCPVDTRHGNYVKVADNPARWEYKPENRKKKPIQDKTFVELTPKEKEELKEKLLKQNYRKIDDIYIAESKLKREDKQTLKQEINNARNLVKLGHEVYLLPYGFAGGDKVRSSDSLTDKRFLEMKDIKPDSSNRMVMDDITSAKGQGEDVYINITNNITEREAIRQMYRALGNVKKAYPNNTKGRIFLNFEKINKIVMFNVNEKGIATKGNPVVAASD